MRLWRIAVLVLLVAHTCVTPCAAKCGQAAQKHSCCVPTAPMCCAGQMSATNRADVSDDAGAVLVPPCGPVVAAAQPVRTLYLAAVRRDVVPEPASVIPLVLRT